MRSIIQRDASTKVIVLAAIIALFIAMTMEVSARGLGYVGELKGTIAPKDVQIVIKHTPMVVYRNPVRSYDFAVGTDEEGIACCTTWDSSKGGTGCASFEGSSCPDYASFEAW